jgi:1,4-dihydroxy-2-naphthoate octaprenyltransferase
VALVGLICLHVSVNVLNEVSDYRSGIDFQTSPTPFSGGSGMLTTGKISPTAAYAAGMTCLFLGGLIGAFFVWVTNVRLLPLLIVGALAVYCYSDLLATHALGEIFAGLGLGLLPVLGASFVQTGHYSPSALAAAIPAGILTFNLLLLNEFPDIEADTQGGRRNLIILFGKRTSGRIYTSLLVIMYLWIIAAVVLGLLPVYCLIALLTLALAWKPMSWAWSGGREPEKMIPSLGANVVTNLATQTLLGIGFLLSIFVKTQA